MGLASVTTSLYVSTHPQNCQDNGQQSSSTLSILIINLTGFLLTIYFVQIEEI